ncbi:uncharacterized protein [Antedon mediterranea]|uniref:uncharacterized protein n=1 Tax=Antedon mediterranea TaxID=105859 RepID=UPI003AF7A80A
MSKTFRLMPNLAHFLHPRTLSCHFVNVNVTACDRTNIIIRLTHSVQLNSNGMLLSCHRTCYQRNNSTDKDVSNLEKRKNETTKAYLYDLGFDTKRIEDKSPTTMKQNLNQIQNSIHFFRNLNLDDKAIQSIVSRQPMLLSRSLDHLKDHVDLLKKYCLTNEQVCDVISRAPRFFSVPVETIKGNVRYAENLQVSRKKIAIILYYYPSTFSRKRNGVEAVCVQILDILKVHFPMDEEIERKMLRSMFMSSPKVFIRSPGEIVRNIAFLVSLGFTDKALYTVVRYCPETLRVYPHYIQAKFDFVQNLFSLDDTDTATLITRYPKFINFQPHVLQAKADMLQEVGFTLQQIQQQPRVFSFSVDTLNRRYKALKEAGYEFKNLRVLTMSEREIKNEVKNLESSTVVEC